VRLIADANVLLAALAGGAAKRFLDHPKVEEIIPAEAVLEEVCPFGRDRCRISVDFFTKLTSIFRA
jgi:hypothetical protein